MLCLEHNYTMNALKALKAGVKQNKGYNKK